MATTAGTTVSAAAKNTPVPIANGQWLGIAKMRQRKTSWVAVKKNDPLDRPQTLIFL